MTFSGSMTIGNSDVEMDRVGTYVGELRAAGDIQDWERESRGIEPVGQAHLAFVRVSKQRDEQFKEEHGLEDKRETRDECTNFKL